MRVPFKVVFLCLSFSATVFAQDTTEMERLNQQVVVLSRQGRYEEAIGAADNLVKILEKTYGANDSLLAVPLDNLAHLYKALSKYAQADSLYRRAYEIRKRFHDPDHPVLAISLDNLAEIARITRKCDEADTLHKQALAIRQKALGPEHPEVAKSLNNLGLTSVCLGEFSQADSCYNRALRIVEKAPRADHRLLASILNNLAELYRIMSRYDEAETLYKRSLKIKERVYGLAHPSVATTLNNLASLYVAQGKYSQAEQIYLRVLPREEKISGPNQPEVANTLDNLASVYSAISKYDKADSLYKQALLLRQNTLGTGHPAVAISLNNLALLYHHLGKYDEAEPLYQQALSIRERALGPGHPEVANSLNNLAKLYSDIGRYDGANSCYTRALAIRKEVYGQYHPSVATSSDNLALFYHHRREYAEAESLYTAALDIREKIFDQNHPDVANSLNNLASLYIYQNKYAEADSLHKRALAISDRALGPNHPNVATSLNNLAVLHTYQGEYTQAESLCVRAISIWENSLGENHPYVSASLGNMAMLKAALGLPEESLDFMQRCLKIDEHTISTVFHLTSEQEKFAFLHTVSFRFEALQSLVAHALRTNQEAVRISLNAVFRRKGLVLEALSRERFALLSSEDPKVMEIIRKLEATNGRLAKLALSGTGELSLEDYRDRLSELEADKERLEAELAQSSAVYASQRQSRGVDIDSVAKCLEQGSALIEFVIIRMQNFGARAGESTWGDYHYLAFVLPAGDRANPVLLDLGQATVIDRAVWAFQDNMARAPEMIERLDEIRAEQKWAEVSHQLYELAFRPLEKHLGNVSTLYLSPDGDLNLIPFGVLKNSNGQYLAEKYQINYVSCGRELARFGRATSNGKGIVIIAAPDFDLIHTAPDSAQGASRRADQRRSVDLKSANWIPLPGAKEEAAAISKMFSERETEVYLGQKATEEAFKNLQSPGILHLSTHGFFLQDEDKSELYGQEEYMRSLQVTERDPSVKIENPLLRSGLALAGANRFGEEEPIEGGEDGILTALEISGMNFWGTDLVVLSACETGVGETRRGEGVFGLRRAFQLAGAKTVVMSLWKVPDQETRELMVDFYKRLKAGSGKASALQNAQLALMRLRQEKYGAAHPFFWGAFICVGEPE